MAISYAGIVLPTFTPEIEARIEAAISPNEVFEGVPPILPSRNREHLGTVNYPPLPPVKLGTVHWPVGACRWGRAHFLIDNNSLANLTPTFKTGAFNALVLSGGTGTVTLNMRMLPPRPVWGSTSAPLWILTLVDQRYDWWLTTADLVIQEGTTAYIPPGGTGGQTTWAALIQAIAAALGNALTIPVLSPGYLFPPASLTSHFEWLPPLLDAVCFSLGLRCTGTALLNFSQAGNIISGNINNAAALGGGQIAGQEVPQFVKVVLPQQTYGLPKNTYTTETVTILGGKLGRTVTLHSSAVVRLPTAGDIGNAPEILALANQIAADYVGWLSLPSVDVRLDGIAFWQPDGLHDIEWSNRAGGRVYTTVRRTPWNTQALDLSHQATPGSGLIGNSLRHGGTGGSLYGKPAVFDQPLTTLSTRSVQPNLFPISIMGVNNDLPIPDCTYLSLICSTAGDGTLATLTGIANPASCMDLYIVNTGPNDLHIPHQDTRSLAEDGFYCPNGMDYVVPPGSGVLVCYDVVRHGWQVIDNPAGTGGSASTMAFFAAALPQLQGAVKNGLFIHNVPVAIGVDLGGFAFTPSIGARSLPQHVVLGPFKPGFPFTFFNLDDPDLGPGTLLRIPQAGWYLIGASYPAIQMTFPGAGQSGQTALPDGLTLALWRKGDSQQFASQTWDQTAVEEIFEDNTSLGSATPNITTVGAASLVNNVNNQGTALVDLSCTGLIALNAGDVIYVTVTVVDQSTPDDAYLASLGGYYWGFQLMRGL